MALSEAPRNLNDLQNENLVAYDITNHFDLHSDFAKFEYCTEHFKFDSNMNERVSPNNNNSNIKNNNNKTKSHKTFHCNNNSVKNQKTYNNMRNISPQSWDSDNESTTSYSSRETPDAYSK